MDAKQEITDVIQKVWSKLQALPQATALEIGTFAVVVLFIGQYKALIFFFLASSLCNERNCVP